MIKKYLFIAIILLFSFSFFAQDSKKDSLSNLLDISSFNKKPHKSLEIINSIYEYSKLSDPQYTVEYIGYAIFICDSVLKDSAKAMKWYQRLGIMYLKWQKYDQAMNYFLKVKNFYEQKKDSVNYAYSLYYLGKTYLGLNVLELAFQEFETALKIFKNHNVVEGIILVNIRLAYFYYSDDYDSAKSFNILFNSLKIVKKDTALKALVYKTIGDLYIEDYRIDSAETYINKSLKNYKLVNDKINIGECYISLGKLYISNENYQLAEENLRTAQKIFENLQVQSKKTEVYNLLGELYYFKNNYQVAEDFFLKAIETAMLNMFLTDQKLFSYQYLSDIYFEQQKYKRAYDYLNKYLEQMKLSFEQNAKQGYTEIILNFQNQEKQKEIELLEKEDALKTQKLKNKNQQIIAFGVVVILLIAFAIVLYFYFRKQKKINELLQEQNQKINFQKKEIESQSKILEKATRDLVKQKDELQTKSNKITASINYASRIQKSMLSLEEIFKKYFKDYFILFMPKETVSGDFYWITEVKDQKPSLFKKEDEDINKIIITVVDCTGHGVPGAFMSLLGDAYLNQIVNVQHIYKPDKILSELHKNIRSTLQQEQTDNNDGMDLALCLIDKKERVIEFAGAKNSLVFVQNNNMKRIHGGMMSVGGLQKEPERYFTTHTVDITAKTQIYLYSDGYQDQFGGKYGRKYMAKPFREFLFKNHKLPAEKQKIELIDNFKKWKGKKYPQMDDVTVIGFTI